MIHCIAMTGTRNVTFQDVPLKGMLISHLEHAPSICHGAGAARGRALALTCLAVEGDECVAGFHCCLGAGLLVPGISVRCPTRAPEPCTKKESQTERGQLQR